MKTSIISITILFIVMASGHAHGQTKPPTNPRPGGVGAGLPGDNYGSKGIKIGKLIFRAVVSDDSPAMGFVFNETSNVRALNGDQPRPATVKKTKISKFVAIRAANDVLQSTENGHGTDLTKADGPSTKRLLTKPVWINKPVVSSITKSE